MPERDLPSPRPAPPPTIWTLLILPERDAVTQLPVDLEVLDHVLSDAPQGEPREAMKISLISTDPRIEFQLASVVPGFNGATIFEEVPDVDDEVVLRAREETVGADAEERDRDR